MRRSGPGAVLGRVLAVAAAVHLQRVRASESRLTPATAIFARDAFPSHRLALAIPTCVCPPTTGPAVTPKSIRAPVDVVAIKGMARWTRVPQVLLAMFAARERSKVVRVDAALVAAFMVDVFPIRDCSDEVLKDNAMGEQDRPLDVHGSVSMDGSAALPEVAVAVLQHRLQRLRWTPIS